jgi:hypothetical protein
MEQAASGRGVHYRGRRRRLPLDHREAPHLKADHTRRLKHLAHGVSFIIQHLRKTTTGQGWSAEQELRQTHLAIQLTHVDREAGEWLRVLEQLGTLFACQHLGVRRGSRLHQLGELMKC